MEQSLPIPQLAIYTSRQMNHLFPDGNDVSALALEALMPMVLHRLETCFCGLLGRHFRRDGVLYFEHLNSDHYSMFLYLLANEAYRAGLNSRDIALKGYLLNKALHGLEAFYEVELPEVFWFSHAVGSVLGRAKYGNGLIVSQGCTVGNKDGIYPVIGEKVVLCANTTILGDCRIGSQVVLGAGCQLIDEIIPNFTTVVGVSPYARILPKKSPLPDLYFTENLPHV
jgi:serine O-acetyltransferase